MKNVVLGGEEVSAIGLGTWQFGSREWGYGTAYAERVAPAIVRRALELGVTFIDTAELYAFGASERIIGRALTAMAGEVGEAPAAWSGFVATKWMPIVPFAQAARRSAAASRRRLGVEVIDLYQLHWPNPFVPERIQGHALGSVLDAGIARHVGVSNHALWRWRAVERAIGRPVASNQVAFSLVQPEPMRTLVPWAAEHGRVVIAYSPLGQGVLARADPVTSGRDVRRFSRHFSRRGLERTARLRAAVADVAAAHAASPAQVALAWLIAPGNVIAIPGARTVAQVEENAAAGDLELAPDELARLSALAEAAAAGLAA